MSKVRPRLKPQQRQKKLIVMFGNRNIRAIAVNRVNDKSDEVIVELDFVPWLGTASARLHASG